MQMNENLDNSKSDSEALRSDPLTQSPSTTVPIRQKHFGFASDRTDKTALETQDVLTCMGLVVVHPNRGLAFMMHLDVPWYCDSVADALTELRNRCGVDNLDQVKLYDVAGVTPIMALVASALAASIAYCIQPWAVLMAIPWIVTSIGTRVRVRKQLKKLGFKPPEILKRTDIDGRPLAWWDFRINVYLSTTGKNAFTPLLTPPKQKYRDPRFLVTPPAPAHVSRWVSAFLRMRAEASRKYIRADGSK